MQRKMQRKKYFFKNKEINKTPTPNLFELNTWSIAFRLKYILQKYSAYELNFKKFRHFLITKSNLWISDLHQLNAYISTPYKSQNCSPSSVHFPHVSVISQPASQRRESKSKPLHLCSPPQSTHLHCSGHFPKHSGGSPKEQDSREIRRKWQNSSFHTFSSQLLSVCLKESGLGIHRPQTSHLPGTSRRSQPRKSSQGDEGDSRMWLMRARGREPTCLGPDLLLHPHTCTHPCQSPSRCCCLGPYSVIPGEISLSQVPHAS